jgi:hypothetical protein
MILAVLEDHPDGLTIEQMHGKIEEKFGVYLPLDDAEADLFNKTG